MARRGDGIYQRGKTWGLDFCDGLRGARGRCGAMALACLTMIGLLGLMLVATEARAECAWVLWVESPLASDRWSVASAPETRFMLKEDCERRAEDLNSFELLLAKMEGASGDARDVYSCLPCIVDPRPEAALIIEGPVPRGPKGK